MVMVKIAFVHCPLSTHLKSCDQCDVCSPMLSSWHLHAYIHTYVFERHYYGHYVPAFTYMHVLTYVCVPVEAYSTVF